MFNQKNLKTVVLFGFFFFSIQGIQYAYATETPKEEAKEALNDAKREVKKVGRAADDKTCRLVNGKTECAAKKIKHSIQNGADNVEDAID